MYLAADDGILRKWKAAVRDNKLVERTYGETVDETIKDESWREAVEQFKKSLTKEDASKMITAIEGVGDHIDPHVKKQLPKISKTDFQHWMDAAKTVANVVVLAKKLLGG
jgi:hypothetical protein